MRILVIGAGQMGAGIAQVAAHAGHDVLLNDISAERVNAGIAGITKLLDRNIEKAKMTGGERDALLGRITPKPDFTSVEVDIAIEAATERLETKLELFRKMEAATPASAILASNTSSISITTLGAVTKRPERVIGMHFMNPVPVMKLVEVIRGIATSDATYATVRDLAVDLGKTPVEARDFPGFVANRILLPMINEAIYALYEGVASIESIDTVMKLGMNHPMGPLQLADFIAIQRDDLLAPFDRLESAHQPAPLVTAGGHRHVSSLRIR